MNTIEFDLGDIRTDELDAIGEAVARHLIALLRSGNEHFAKRFVGWFTAMMGAELERRCHAAFDQPAAVAVPQDFTNQELAEAMTLCNGLTYNVDGCEVGGRLIDLIGQNLTAQAATRLSLCPDWKPGLERGGDA